MDPDETGGSVEDTDGGAAAGAPPVDTLAALATADDHPGATALRTIVGDPDREYDYRRLRTDGKKSGNLLAGLGVREGRTLAIAADPPVPEAVLALLGAGLLGTVVRFAPPSDPDVRAVLAPTERVGDYDLPAGGQRVGYGDPPGDPTVTHFERVMWSENPTFPPSSVDPGDPLLTTGEKTHSHRAVLSAAHRVVADLGLGPDHEVAVRADLGDPGTVAAGVVAPLLAGATVLLPQGDDAAGTGDHGTVAVATGAAPEPRTVDPGAVEFDPDGE